MAITRFQDLPSTDTPINSANLNGNFDELGAKVGTSIDSNYRVNIIKNKNLLNPSNIITGIYSIANGNYVADSNARCTKNKIKIDNTKNYVLSVTTSSTGNYMYVFFYDNNANYLGNISTLIENGSIAFNLFNNYSNAKYVHFRFDTTNLTDLMLEEGNSKTTYIPYNRSINIDGEDIYVKGQNEVYSTVEQRIGTWIDGKPIYRKVSTGITNTSSNYYTLFYIPNIEVINMYGILKRANGHTSNLPGFNGSQGLIQFLYYNNNTYQMYVGDISQAGTYKVFIEYTKTTD